MIISHLPAFDLLVLQQVNSTWKGIINDPKRKSIQMKLFMVQDPPEEQWGKAFGANGLRWNPFLEHFGRLRNPRPGSHEYRVRIKREDLRKKPSWKEILRKIDRPEASWKRMYVSYPTRLELRAFWEPGSVRTFLHGCRYPSRHEAEQMDFLTYVDEECSNHGHRSKRDFFWMVAEC